MLSFSISNEKVYVGTKTLKAWPLTRGQYNEYRGGTIPHDEDPDDLGYLVEYEPDGTKANHPAHDGYISWSPASVFEKTYHELSMQASPAGYNPALEGGFSWALAKMKDGKPVARSGWNGTGMFAYSVPAASYPAQTGVAKQYFGENSMVPYRAYYALKGADGQVATWVPSSTDLDAEDWYVVE